MSHTTPSPNPKTRLPALGRRHAALVFWPALTVWTWLLVKPSPFPELAKTLAGWHDLLPFLAAKSLHMSGYTFLTVFGLAAVPPRWRKGMVLFMTAHAVLGELGQYLGNVWFATNRGGSVRDVLVDWVGIALGVGVWVAARRYRTPPSSGV